MKNKYYFLFFIFVGITVTVSTAAYIEFYFAPYSDLRFVISGREKYKIYEPHSEITYGIQKRKAQVNRHGLIGSEKIRENHKFVLSLGTCTLLDSFQEITEEINGRNLKIDYVSGALGHLSVREVLVQLKVLLREVKPDVLLVPLGTVFVRDIEFYNKDYYAIPKSVIRERAFNYREGGILNWLSFSWERRFNQLYYADDRKEIQPYLLKLKKQNSFDPTETVNRCLQSFSEDVILLAEMCEQHNIKLIAQTPPFNWEITSPRQKKILAQFNDKIQELSVKNNFSVLHLSNKESVQKSENFFYDLVHLNQKGARVVAKEVVDYFEKNVL